MKRSIPVIPTVGMLLLASFCQAAPVSAPYTENFNDGLADDFTFTSSTIYTVTNSALRANITSAGSASAAVQMNTADWTSFTVSTQFTFASFNQGAGNLNAGLGLLGDTANFSAGNEYRLLFQVGGALQLQEASMSRATSGVMLSMATNTLYTLTVTGTYLSASSLKLDASLSNGTNTVSLTYTDTSPRTGQYFGYRTATSSTATVDVSYDNFSVTAIPEPSACAMVFGAVAGAAGIVRRRPSRSVRQPRPAISA